MSIDAFADILLEDTFVLAWYQSKGRLTFHVVASLLPTHPAASPPDEGDWACYRSGIIAFSGVSDVQGLKPQSCVATVVDAAGDVDYGSFDEFRLIQQGRYRVSGEFGEVLVDATDVSLHLVAAA